MTAVYRRIKIQSHNAFAMHRDFVCQVAWRHHGFFILKGENRMPASHIQILRMRKLLDPPFDPPLWPAGVYLTELVPGIAREVHDLLVLGYQNGGGSVAPFPDWWSALVSDPEFDASLCFLAWDEAGIAGVAQCWTSAFVKDLVVHPRRRGQGLAHRCFYTPMQFFIAGAPGPLI